MRTYPLGVKTISAVVLFFFVWTFGPVYAPIAWAAESKQKSGVKSQESRVRSQESGERRKPETTGERFEKAIEEIRDKIERAEEKAGWGDAATEEIEAIKARKAEIETLDVELRKEFTATEKKLKDAKLPKEILDRHYKFVKHYNDNLKELRANLEAVDKYAVDSKQGKEALRKTKEHLERTKPPSKHVPLDPNNLPFRTVKGKERAPRLKPEEFQRDFGPGSRVKGQVARVDNTPQKKKDLATNQHEFPRNKTAEIRDADGRR